MYKLIIMTHGYDGPDEQAGFNRKVTYIPFEQLAAAQAAQKLIAETEVMASFIVYDTPQAAGTINSRDW